MFNLTKRSAFQTVGDLRELLCYLPAETRVCICGDISCFYHEEEDRSTICLNCEDLEECYEGNALPPISANKDDPLTLFIKQEVPHRLQEILDLPEEQVTDEIVAACVEALNSNSDILFNYDRIDDKLEEILKTFGIAGRNG